MPDSPPLTEAALLARVALGEHTRQQFKRTFHSPDPVTDPVMRLLQTLADGPLAPSEIQQRLALKHRPTFKANYLRAAVEGLWIEPTPPDKPNSRLQQYRLTEKGKALLK